MTKAIAFLKQWFWLFALLGFIFAVGGWVTFTELSMAANGEKIATNKDDIKSNQAIMKEQHDLQLQQAQLLEKMAGQLEVILQLIGVTVTDSTMTKWRSMPKELPIDSFGNPVIGKEWLCVTADHLYGRIMKWTDGDTVLVMIAWDKRRPR